MNGHWKAYDLNSKPLIFTNMCEYLPTVVVSGISVRSCGMHCRQSLEVTSSPGADVPDKDYRRIGAGRDNDI